MSNRSHRLRICLENNRNVNCPLHFPNIPNKHEPNKPNKLEPALFGKPPLIQPIGGSIHSRNTSVDEYSAGSINIIKVSAGMSGFFFCFFFYFFFYFFRTTAVHMPCFNQVASLVASGMHSIHPHEWRNQY